MQEPGSSYPWGTRARRKHRGVFQVKFMFIVTSSQSVGPSPKLLEEMHKLAKREIDAGRMLDNGGLMPIAQGARVRIEDGQLRVLDGPFTETKEVIGGHGGF